MEEEFSDFSILTMAAVMNFSEVREVSWSSLGFLSFLPYDFLRLGTVYTFFNLCSVVRNRFFVSP